MKTKLLFLGVAMGVFSLFAHSTKAHDSISYIQDLTIVRSGCLTGTYYESRAKCLDEGIVAVQQGLHYSKFIDNMCRKPLYLEEQANCYTKAIEVAADPLLTMMKNSCNSGSYYEDRVACFRKSFEQLGR